MRNKILYLSIIAVGLCVQSCNTPFVDVTSETDYNRYSTDYDPNIDSWKQIDPGDEDINVTWFMDYSWASQKVENLIYERTGVRVKFQNATNSTHSELNTMIAGNRLPDIISVDNTSLRVQLAEEGYCYALNKLAESYAPSMLKRISPDHWDYYKASDGNTYALASHYYNESDIKEFDELGGHQYNNGSIIVNKKYLEEYLAYKKSIDPSFDQDKEVTKPSGFIEMCKWVKQKHYPSNASPVVCFSPFSKTGVNDIISQSLTALTEFMGVPLEDSNGDLVYQYATPEFYDVVKFINTLYKENLFVTNNFSYEQGDIDTKLLNGDCFAFIGNEQTHRSPIAKREFTHYSKYNDSVPDEYQYVGIVLTNEKGDAPLLLDYAGKGLYQVMITKNCNREDRVIKVLDYLYSEQGMREVIYGKVEGEYYNYTVRPGQVNPRTGKTSTYGVIETTDKMKKLITNAFSASLSNYGLAALSPVVNPMYARMVSEEDDFIGIVAPWYWTVYNTKKAYFDYTASRRFFRYPLDTSSIKALNTYTDQLSDIEKAWIEALPKMIMANNDTELKSIYDNTLSKTYTLGANEYLAFRNKCFKAYKEKNNIQYAWAKADPNYQPKEVKLYGSADKYLSRPSWVYGGID